MKQKNFKKKLRLNKLTLSALNTDEMIVRGGVIVTNLAGVFCPGGDETVAQSCPGFTVSKVCFQVPQGACC